MISDSKPQTEQPVALLKLILFTRITDTFHSKSIQTFETLKRSRCQTDGDSVFISLSFCEGDVLNIYSQRHREYVLCCTNLRLFKFLKKTPAGQLRVFSFVMSER